MEEQCVTFWLIVQSFIPGSIGSGLLLGARKNRICNLSSHVLYITFQSIPKSEICLIQSTNNTRMSNRTIGFIIEFSAYFLTYSHFCSHLTAENNLSTGSRTVLVNQSTFCVPYSAWASALVCRVWRTTGSRVNTRTRVLRALLAALVRCESNRLHQIERSDTVPEGARRASRAPPLRATCPRARARAPPAGTAAPPSRPRRPRSPRVSCPAEGGAGRR